MFARRTFHFRDSSISQLADSVSSLEKQVAQMALEKDDLLVKIEAGEGASTALTQLKQGRQKNSRAFLGPISAQKLAVDATNFQNDTGKSGKLPILRLHLPVYMAIGNSGRF